MTDTGLEKRVTVRMDEQMHERLNNLSDERGVKVSDLIRDVLNAYLIRQ